MTTYRLRDKERQAALEKALPGFGEILQDKCEKFFDNSNAIRVCNADDGWEIYISKTDIKAVDDYNPYTWNSFPEVEPPDGVLMRVERSDGAKRCAYFHNFSDGGCWCYSDGMAWPKTYSDKVVRFRPWDDSENAKE